VSAVDHLAEVCFVDRFSTVVELYLFFDLLDELFYLAFMD
jgi:hypothetical protein